MNPKHRREKNVIRWWFAPTDIEGTAPSGTILYSPSGVRFLVVERYKVPPKVPEVPGEVEAISAVFDLVGPHKPSAWSRVYSDPSIAARAIVATLQNLYTPAQVALFKLDGANLTDKGAALSKITRAEQTSNIADALDASRSALRAFGFQVPDPPPSGESTDTTDPPPAQPQPDRPGPQVVSTVDWWALGKVGLVGLAIALIASKLSDEE